MPLSQMAIEAQEEAGGHVRRPGHGGVPREAGGSLCKMTFGWTPGRRDQASHSKIRGQG